MATPTPNLNILIGEAETKSLLALPSVTLPFLVSSSAAKILYLGSIHDQQEATAAPGIKSDAAVDVVSTPNSWIYTQIRDVSSIQNAKIRRKAATLLAEAIKKCAAVDQARGARDGAIGKVEREKFDKALDHLVPKVEYIDEEDRVENAPVDIFDSAGQNKNAKHRSGARFKNEKRLLIIDKTMSTMLNRCATDDQKEQVMTTRGFQALMREKEDLQKKIMATNQEIQSQQQKSGDRRDREGNTVVVENQNAKGNDNDDDDDYYSGI